MLDISVRNVMTSDCSVIDVSTSYKYHTSIDLYINKSIFMKLNLHLKISKHTWA